MGRGGGEDLWGPKTRTRLVRTAPVGCANYDRMELRTRQPNAGRRRDVASLGIRPRTQNGHIRNDTRDLSRRIWTDRNGPDLQAKVCRESPRVYTSDAPEMVRNAMKEGLAG